MSHFIDDLSRILATPMPRRKALRLLAGALTGAFLASLGTERAQAACSPACTGGQTCCNNAICCNATDTCCFTNDGTVCCPSGTACCTHNNGHAPACCPTAFASGCNNGDNGANTCTCNTPLTNCPSSSPTTCCTSSQCCTGSTCGTPCGSNCCTASQCCCQSTGQCVASDAGTNGAPCSSTKTACAP